MGIILDEDIIIKDKTPEEDRDICYEHGAEEKNKNPMIFRRYFLKDRIRDAVIFWMIFSPARNQERRN